MAVCDWLPKPPDCALWLDPGSCDVVTCEKSRERVGVIYHPPFVAAMSITGVTVAPRIIATSGDGKPPPTLSEALSNAK